MYGVLMHVGSSDLCLRGGIMSTWLICHNFAFSLPLRNYVRGCRSWWIRCISVHGALCANQSSSIASCLISEWLSGKKSLFCAAYNEWEPRNFNTYVVNQTVASKIAMPALKKSIRNYSIKRRWMGSNSLDRIYQNRRKWLLSMAFRLAILARGRSRTRLLITCFILKRQVYFDSGNWLSDIPNPPVIRYEYTFETYPGDFWSDFRVKSEHIRDWHPAFGFVNSKRKRFFWVQWKPSELSVQWDE